MRLLLALAILGSLLGPTDQATKPTLADLAWMTGSWSGAANGIEMEEHWTAPKGNSMIGIHRDIGKGRIEGTMKGKAASEEWRWTPGALK